MAKNTCSEAIKRADLFPQEMEMLFQDGRPYLQTHFGALLAVILVTILMAYGSFKAEIMIDYEDIKITEPIMNGYFEPDFSHGSKNGFQVAFGAVSYTDPTAAPIDESYGRVVAYEISWGFEGTDIVRQELKTRKCTGKDFI